MRFKELSGFVNQEVVQMGNQARVRGQPKRHPHRVKHRVQGRLIPTHVKLVSTDLVSVANPLIEKRAFTETKLGGLRKFDQRIGVRRLQRKRELTSTFHFDTH